MEHSLAICLKTEAFEKLVSDQDAVVETVSNLFETSLANDLVPSYIIEEKIMWSKQFRDLERGEDQTFLSPVFYPFFMDFYQIKNNGLFKLSQSEAGRWIGKMYAEIFFRYHLSFSAIISIIGIDEMKGFFLTYHDYEDESFISFFGEKMKSFNLFASLLKKNGMSIKELANRTSIKPWTLISYTRTTEAIYKASSESLYLICRALDVPFETFIRSLW